MLKEKGKIWNKQHYYEGVGYRYIQNDDVVLNAISNSRNVLQEDFCRVASVASYISYCVAQKATCAGVAAVKKEPQQHKILRTGLLFGQVLEWRLLSLDLLFLLSIFF